MDGRNCELKKWALGDVIHFIWLFYFSIFFYSTHPANHSAVADGPNALSGVAEMEPEKQVLLVNESKQNGQSTARYGQSDFGGEKNRLTNLFFFIWSRN